MKLKREQQRAIVGDAGSRGHEGEGTGLAIAGRCAMLGFEEIVPALAQRGDLLLLDRPNGAGEEPYRSTVGVMGMNGAGLFVDTDGLAEVPLEACRRAWRVS